MNNESKNSSRAGSRNLTRDFSSGLSRGGMGGGDEPTLSRDFIQPGDLQGLVNWLDNPKNQRSAVDAITFAPEPEQERAFVDFISSSPEFRAWDKDEVSQAVSKANELDLMERLQEAAKIAPGDFKRFNEWASKGFEKLPELFEGVTEETFVHGILESLQKRHELSGWSKVQLEEALFLPEQKVAPAKPSSKKILESTIKNAIRRGFQEALDTKPVKRVKISRKQLAEGIRKAIKGLV